MATALEHEAWIKQGLTYARQNELHPEPERLSMGVFQAANADASRIEGYMDAITSDCGLSGFEFQYIVGRIIRARQCDFGNRSSFWRSIMKRFFSLILSGTLALSAFLATPEESQAHVRGVGVGVGFRGVGGFRGNFRGGFRGVGGAFIGNNFAFRQFGVPVGIPVPVGVGFNTFAAAPCGGVGASFSSFDSFNSFGATPFVGGGLGLAANILDDVALFGGGFRGGFRGRGIATPFVGGRGGFRRFR